MKKQISVQGGAASGAPQRWPDSKKRPIRTPPVFLVLALFTLFTGSGAYAQSSKLANISSQLVCLTGEGVVVSEFVIQGGDAKQVLVRAIGPSLNVPGPLLDPTMELCDSAGTIIRANNNWKDSQQSALEATGLPPVHDRESAIVATLAPGLYFTVVRGVSNTNGVALSEVYDLGGSASSFTALGTRGYVGASENLLVSGVILSGSQNQDVLVRALGSSLANSGLSAALPNPTLELRDGNGSLLAANDNWQTSQETAIQNSGLAPSSAFESAIIANLPPGNYTSITRGAQNSAGVGFVQFHTLPYSGSPLNPAPSLPTLPVITSPLAASGTVGQLFTYQFEATDATSLAVTNPPPGLAYDGSLRAIVGNPTASGTFQTGLSATNAAGTTNATLTITVQQPPSSGPIIVSGTAATVRTGRPFSFGIVATGGSPSTRLSASGLPTGVTADPVTGVISGTHTSDGSFPITLTVTDGDVTATSTLQLTVTSDPARPVIISPSSASVVPGQFFSYTINTSPASDPSHPINFSFLGELPSGLTFDSQTGTISGTFTGQFGHDGVSPNRPTPSGGIVTNIQLFADGGTVPMSIFGGPTGVVNISTRLAAGTGDNVLIAGFIITGNAPEVPELVIIRALGPSVNVPNPLADTILQLFDGEGKPLGENDDWTDTQEDEIKGTYLQPSRPQESAIFAILKPGNYTAHVRGKTNLPGIAVVEVYDLRTASLNPLLKARLANISTRGFVERGDNVLIGGTIIVGQDVQRVLVRAIGPSLTVPGKLEDPTLTLYDANGHPLATNDNWPMSDQAEDIIATTIPPTDPLESAIIATLPGNGASYTAIVRGAKDDADMETSGVAVVEVYVLELE